MWWVFPYISMNRPQVHVSSPILNPPPPSLPTLSLWLVPEHQIWVPCFMYQTCTGYLFYIQEYTCFNAILSNHPTLIGKGKKKISFYSCSQWEADKQFAFHKQPSLFFQTHKHGGTYIYYCDFLKKPHIIDKVYLF